jgi:sugar phosphate isomerase/epimerase
MRTFSPKLALCNFIDDTKALKELALDYGFHGVDWTFNYHNLPQTPREERALVEKIAGLYPLGVRYHCFFPNMDIGAVHDDEATQAMKRFRSVCKLVQKLHGRTMTIHVGLGRESTADLSWDKTLEGLAALAIFASRSGLRLCVENLARGWTSRPVLYEKIMRKSMLWGTLDIGHAQVCAQVRTRVHDVEDFVEPHLERFLNAHIYHEETMEGHIPPQTTSDVAHRLRLLLSLPALDWWVLELREEQALMKTLRIVRSFLEEHAESMAYADAEGTYGQLGFRRAAGQ